MLVNDQNFTTIWYEDDLDKVKIIDQRLLPHEFKIITLNSLTDAAFAIKEMQVRGAPLIGVTAAYGMYLASKQNSEIDFLIDSGYLLKKTRPTAINLSWAVDKIIHEIKSIDKNKRKEFILEIANSIRKNYIEAWSKIGEYVLKLIE